jgi:hypothetical protein
MELNSTSLVERQNRPTVLQRVALRAFFINEGAYYDPYDISGVTVFAKSSNLTPSSVVVDNVVASSVTSSLILAHFAPSGDDGGFPAQDPSGYNPTTDNASLSGVYRTGVGKYVCVLDGVNPTNASANYNFYGSSVTVTNTASAVNDYLDVWTVKFTETGTYQSLIQDFHLYDDTFFTITEPLIFHTTNRLVNKHLTLDSVDNLKFTTELTIENKGIDDSIKNIFKDSVITNAQVKIEKINEDTVTLPAHVTVSGYNDTSGIAQITSDNTVLVSFDTRNLATHASVAQFGGLTGTYRATLKYTLLDEIVVTPPYYFTLQ